MSRIFLICLSMLLLNGCATKDTQLVVAAATPKKVCTSESRVGSNIPITTCMSEEDHQLILEASKERLEEMRRPIHPVVAIPGG